MKRLLFVVTLALIGGWGVYKWLEKKDAPKIDAQSEVINSEKEDLVFDFDNSDTYQAINSQVPFESEKKVEGLNSELEKVASMSAKEISEKLKKGNEKIAKENLIKRLNNGKASPEEIEEAKVLFESMALMSLEQANRKMKESEPELRRGLESIGQELAEIRSILQDE